MKSRVLASLAFTTLVNACCTIADASCGGLSTDPVPACVCAFDPFCCSVSWDFQCVNEAKGVCGLLCEECAVYEPPTCDLAESQSPRDLTTTSSGTISTPGYKPAKAAVLTNEQTDSLALANVHWHYGAEHKSNEFSDDTDSIAWDNDPDHEGPRPGFMCSTADLTEAQLAPYNFQHCQGQHFVGKSYEVHYVHSSAGVEGYVEDGLGWAVSGRGIKNPMISVQGLVFQIINDDSPEYTDSDLYHGYYTYANGTLEAKYAGSSTGKSFNNEICSPYEISWHVSLDCHRVSAASFDQMCQYMESLGYQADLFAHSSRILVDADYVVPADEVKVSLPEDN